MPHGHRLSRLLTGPFILIVTPLCSVLKKELKEMLDLIRCYVPAIERKQRVLNGRLRKMKDVKLVYCLRSEHVYLLLFSQIIDMFSMKLGDASDTEQQAGDSNINPDSSVPIATELSEVLELSKMCLRAIQNLQDEQDRIFDEMEGTECLNGMNY